MDCLDAAGRSVKQHELPTVCHYCGKVGEGRKKKVGEDQIDPYILFHAKKLRLYSQSNGEVLRSDVVGSYFHFI